MSHRHMVDHLSLYFRIKSPHPPLSPSRPYLTDELVISHRVGVETLGHGVLEPCHKVGFVSTVGHVRGNVLSLRHGLDHQVLRTETKIDKRGPNMTGTSINRYQTTRKHNNTAKGQEKTTSIKNTKKEHQNKNKNKHQHQQSVQPGTTAETRSSRLQ